MKVAVCPPLAELLSFECSFSTSRRPEDLPLDDPAEFESPPEKLTEPSDLEELDFPQVDDDDARWEAFIPDDDERDPQPQPGDFWIDFDLGASREAA